MQSETDKNLQNQNQLVDAHNNERISRPLFSSLDEPSADIIGHILTVNCGHTGHPTPSEAYMMELHLKQARFMPPKEKTKL